MRIALLGKYPPLQGGVSTQTYWAAYQLADRGHHLHIVTNGDEVEFGLRQYWWGDDKARLEPAELAGSIQIHRTVPLAPESHVPWSHAYGSRLFGRTIAVMKAVACDLIIGWYLEPYGISAALVGEALGKPVAVIHAGSDLAILSRHPDLEPAFRWMLGCVEFVLSGGDEQVLSNLRFLGADDEKLVSLHGSRLPAIFHQPAAPLELHSLTDGVVEWYRRSPLDHSLMKQIIQRCLNRFDPEAPTIGTYGKVGPSKGSYELLEALDSLARRGARFNFLSVSGEIDAELARYFEAILARGCLAERTCLLPFVAPWRIPSLLDRCDVICQLERGFPVSSHSSMIPREVFARGRCLLCSAEVASKIPFRDSLANRVNFAQVTDPRDVRTLADRIESLLKDPGRLHAIGKRAQLLSETVEHWLPSTDGVTHACERLFDRGLQSAPSSDSADQNIRYTM